MGHHAVRGTGALTAPESPLPKVSAALFLPCWWGLLLLPPQQSLHGASGRGPAAPPSLPASSLTWQPQHGEVAPALREARALPDTGTPQPLVVEYSCHRVVVQILGAPLVHAGGSDDAPNPDQGNHKPQALAGGHGHGGVQCRYKAPHARGTTPF